MKITVRPFLTLRPVMRNLTSIEWELDDITLRNLLDRLCEEFGGDLEAQVFDPKTQDISNMLKVLVNGRHYTTLDEKLETVLQDGDEISLFPPVAGG